SRLEVGEGTRTDVAQAEASRSEAVARVSAARAQALASAATYRQIVGDDPGNLKPASPLGKLLPRSLDAAMAIAAREHPAILAMEHLVDAAAFSVKSAEGALLPGVTASAEIFRTIEGVAGPGASDGYSTFASIGATLTI